MIEVNNVWKSFNDKPVHQGITFNVRAGETMVILGKSGGGKSVLLKMVMGLITPDEGNVLVEGTDVAKVSYEDLRSLRFKFGFLFQGAALFDSMTVAENIALPLRRNPNISDSEINERIRHALDIVGLENVENVMPASLSGGMKKRVGLARAIAPEPKYILYDEPVTGLDVRTADAINLLINDLKSRMGVTSLVVTHNINTAFFVGDRFTIIHNGKTLISGTKDEIESSPNEDVQKYTKSSLSQTKVKHDDVE